MLLKLTNLFTQEEFKKLLDKYSGRYMKCLDNFRLFQGKQLLHNNPNTSHSFSNNNYMTLYQNVCLDNISVKFDHVWDGFKK